MTGGEGVAGAGGGDRLTATALVAGGLVYYFSYWLAMPFGFADEGYLYYLARALAGGQLPYQDVRLFSYLPGLFYAVSPLLRFPGHEIEVARGAMALLLVLRSWLVFACLRRLTGRGAATVAALLVLLVPGPWHKLYVGLLAAYILWALLFFLAADSSGRAARAAHLGLAVGVAAVLRIDVAMVGAGLACLALICAGLPAEMGGGRVGPRAGFRLALLTAGVAAAVHLPLLLSLAWRGLLGDYARQWSAFFGMAAWRASTDLKLAPPRPEMLLRLDRQGAEALLYFLAVAAILAYAALYLRRPRDGASLARLVVGLWAIGGLPQFAFERPDVTHLTQYSVFFLVPAAVLAGAGLRRLDGAATARRRRALLALLAGLASFYAGKHLYFAEGGSAGVLRRPAHRVTLANGFSYPAAADEPFRRLLKTILEGSSPSETVAALPFMPGVAFATGRSLVGRDVFLAPHSVAEPGAEQAYLEALRQSPPRFLVLWPTLSFDGRPSGRLESFAPRVYHHLTTDYRVAGHHPGLWLLEPCATAPSGRRPALAAAAKAVFGDCPEPAPGPGS